MKDGVLTNEVWGVLTYEDGVLIYVGWGSK